MLSLSEPDSCPAISPNNDRMNVGMPLAAASHMIVSVACPLVKAS